MAAPRRTGIFALALASLALLGTACTQGASKEEVAAKDQQIASLQTQLAGTQQDVKYWEQMTALLQPVPMKSMTDHRAYMLPSGVVLALHFDNMDLSKAQNLNWTALGIPGEFCKADQERLEKQYGPGFTHFHDMQNDTHGGQPRAKGVWFIHTAVREFDAPWGHVKPGVDNNFMPTPAPVC